VKDRSGPRRRHAGATAQDRGEDLGLDALRERKRTDLLAIAKRLGLTGVSNLKKEALALRIHEASRPPAAAASQAAAEAVADAPDAAREEAPAATAGPERAATAKLDLGPAAGAAEQPVGDIPWSYGEDRVTAMAVDPLKLFVYWEVTDPAVAQAREALHAGGPGAWLNLRVYDTSGLIFDGTNARSYFDHRVERHDRQWFFTVGKPTSSAYVELGLRSDEGFFVRIARSGRVDFPRLEPMSGGDPEWLTVRPATGEARSAGRGGPAKAPRPPGRAAHSRHAAVPVFELVGDDDQISYGHHGDGRRIEWRQLLGGAGWFELGARIEWEGPLVVSSWEEGPFTYPVTVEAPSREEWEGRSFAYRVGEVTRVVYGPWRVVIRNLGARHERAEIGRWEVFRSWVATAGREVRVSSLVGNGLLVGASEALGASERRWIAGSELRLGGASEVWRIGASELRLGGASETLFVGASRWIARGASERRLGGASESRLAGASERRLAGGSEQRLGAGSESRLGGGSEQRALAGPGRDGRSDDEAAPLSYPSLGG
jgi:hypothetical protein